MNKTLLESFIRFNNINIVNEAKAKNRGTFFLSGHFSNWELAAFAFSKMNNEKLKAIAKIQASRGLNERINEYRKLSGNEVIDVGASLRSIFEMVKKNDTVCFLIDQSANPDYSTYIKFFGNDVPAFSGPAKLALKLNPVLFLVYFVRNDDYSYTMFFEEINFPEGGNYSEENVTSLTQLIQSKLEEVIRRNPSQWLWFHKRFKHMRNSLIR